MLNFLKSLASLTPAISDLPLINRTSGNSGLCRGLLSDISSVFLSNSFSIRSLIRSNDARNFIRVWKVMRLCFQILGQGKLVAQRELFYKLLCDTWLLYISGSDVLRCSRQSLGIMASTRGVIIGRLRMQIETIPGLRSQAKRPSIVLCLGLQDMLSGDLTLLSKLNFDSDARYIIIVEKDAIFQRLAEDRLYNQVPSILITAKGYSDMATRNVTEASCLQWLRRGIEWKFKLSTATSMISWGSTLQQRLYSLISSENTFFSVSNVFLFSFFFLSFKCI